MSASTIFGYVVILVAAVCVDVVLFRYRRRNGTPDSSPQVFEQLWSRLDGLYEQARRAASGRLQRAAAAKPPAVVPAASAPVEPARPRQSLPAAVPAPLPARPPAQRAVTPPAASTPVRPAPAVAAQPIRSEMVRVSPLAPLASRPAVDGSSGLARVNVSVELPVGATIRLTIETSPGLEPRVTVDSSPQPWALAPEPAAVLPAETLPTPEETPTPEPASAEPPVAEDLPLPDEEAVFQAAAATFVEAVAAPVVEPALEPAASPTGPPDPISEALTESIADRELAAPSVAAPAAAPRGAAPSTARPSSMLADVRALWQRLGRAWRVATDIRDRPLTMILFGLAAVAYVVSRLVGLDRFPIYFFTDEAVQTLQAASLIAHGMHDAYGVFLPTYFQNGVYYNLSLSVYAQVLPTLLFGKSIWLTRGTPALISLLAPLTASLALKNVFKVSWWWLGALLLVVTPAWFLHSRTGFETVIMTALYAGFIYCYLLYRYRSPRYLYPALLLGAMAFYSYNGGQITVVLTGVLLLVSDFPYHWANRRTGWRALIFLGVLILPYVRFTLQHPEAAGSQLRNLDSYWLHADLTVFQKFGMFLSEYTFGLSPQFWYAADNGRDLVRHIMKGYGHLALWTLPFLVAGLYTCIRKLRQSAYRVLLLTLLAAPVGGAITSVGITRVLVFVVPAALVTAIGVETVWNWIPRRQRWTSAAAVGIFAAVGVFGFAMMRDALVNGPVWYSDYELGGLQWGARQLFGEQIPALLERDPQLQVYVSPSWANGTELFPQFFLTEAQSARVQLQGVAYYLAEKHDLPSDLLVVLPPEEYSQVDNNPKFVIQKVEQILNYPNGQPGFYFLRLAYAPNADELFAQEHAALLRPIVETYTIDGQAVVVTHPRFGAGQLSDMLDGDKFTLINAPGFNPVVLDFAFPQVRPISGLDLTTGSMDDFTVKVSLYANADTAPQVYTQHYVNLPPDPTVKLNFDQGPATINRIQIEIQNNVDTGPGVNIHVREVQFR